MTDNPSRQKIQAIANLVEAACQQKTNQFGYRIWHHHVLPVVKYGKLLAKKIGANEEIVEIAALLHDYASIKDFSKHEDHHLYGAQDAQKIMAPLRYSLEQIQQVQHCILSHRGSKPREKLTPEARCLADADGMAHFDAIPSLFYFTLVRQQMSLEEGTEWLVKKLTRSWNKLSAEAKTITKAKYKAWKLLFNPNSRESLDC